MDAEEIWVPEPVRTAIEAAPVPSPGPGPEPPDLPTVPSGELGEALHALALEIDTRFAVVWADIEQMQKGLGIAIEDVEWPG